MDKLYANYLNLSRPAYIDYLKMTIAMAELTISNEGQKGIEAETVQLARECREDARKRLQEIEEADKEEAPQ